MQPKTSRILLAMLLAAGVAPTPLAAAGPNACTVSPRSVAAERDRDRERREADESRVADWLTKRILEDVENTNPVLDISAEEIEAATGVDAETLDADRVRERVTLKLRELAAGPGAARPGVYEPIPAARVAPEPKPATSAEPEAEAKPAPRTQPAVPGTRPAPEARPAPRTHPAAEAKTAPKSRPAPEAKPSPTAGVAPRLEPTAAIPARAGSAAETPTCSRTTTHH